MIRMRKIKLIIVSILIVCVFSSCSESTTNSETAATTKLKPTTEDYLNTLYGYHESNDICYWITENLMETKNKSDKTLRTSKISISVVTENDKVYFNIEKENSNKIFSIYIDSDGILYDDYGNQLTKISKEQYDSLEAVVDEPETTVSDDFDEDNIQESPWYSETFNIYSLRTDLQYIENLLAVGNESEALVAIKEMLFDQLDKTVDKLIKSREYWAAYNYVAMYNEHLSSQDTDIYGSYPFLEDYFEEKYTSDDAIYGISKRGFSDFTQKYYLKIIKAKKADKHYISEQECLYKLNEYFLQNGYKAVSGLWENYYMYQTSNLDQNFVPTEYYIVCPYTKQIRYIPAEFYFMDKGHFLEGVLGKYM